MMGIALAIIAAGLFVLAGLLFLAETMKAILRVLEDIAEDDMFECSTCNPQPPESPE